LTNRRDDYYVTHGHTAYHVEHKVQGTLPDHGFSLLLSVERACVEHYPECIVLSCPGMEDITFQIKGLLMGQSQKSLRQSEIPDFVAAMM